MTKYLILINPVSGSINNRKIKRIKKLFSERGASFRVFLTSGNGSATAIVKNQFNDEFTHMVVVGGDGSLNEALNGLENFNRPIGLVSTGTGNDYIKNFKCGTSIDDQVMEILGSGFSMVSVGRCNGRLFLNGMGAGFDGQISHNMTYQKTWLGGHLAYYYHVLRILGLYKERVIDFSIDGKKYRDPLLLIMAGLGTTFGGGFKLLPHGNVSADEMAVCIIRKIHPLKRFFWLNFMKYGKHERIQGVEFFKAKSVIIEEADLKGQIDGELAGNAPFKIDILPEKLKFLMRTK